MFISFEGSDGVGKSTQIALLSEYLKSREIPFICTREPGGTPVGERIREMLLDPAAEMTPETEAYLYAASRAEHVRRVIRPALDSGKFVLCDRFVHSSYAYQGFGRELGLGTVMRLNEAAVAGLMPERVYLFLAPEEVGKQRKMNVKDYQPDRLEREADAFFDRVREGFTAFADSDPSVLAIDASDTIENIAQTIRADIDRLLEGVSCGQNRAHCVN
jgi:dTMP kinase